MRLHENVRLNLHYASPVLRYFKELIKDGIVLHRTLNKGLLQVRVGGRGHSLELAIRELQRELDNTLGEEDLFLKGPPRRV